MKTACKTDRLDDSLSDTDKARRRIEVTILLLTAYCCMIVMLVFCVYNARADEQTGIDDETSVHKVRLDEVRHGSLLFNGEISEGDSHPLLQTHY